MTGYPVSAYFVIIIPQAWQFITALPLTLLSQGAFTTSFTQQQQQSCGEKDNGHYLCFLINAAVLFFNPFFCLCVVNKIHSACCY